jgi:type I restriction enzyme, S subunit
MGQQWKLPVEWEWRRLGEVTEINPRRPSIQRSDSTPTAFIPMNAVDEVEGKVAEVQVKPFDEVRRGYTYFEEGDVLLAKITPSMENGKAAIAQDLIDGFGFGTTEFHVLRPNKPVLPHWIHHYIRRVSFRQEARQHFRGAVGQQRVPQDFLESYPIPIPYPDDPERSLTEQRRIVARIEALFAELREARTLHEAIVADTGRLMEAVLGEVFSFSDDLPSGWTWSTIEDVGLQGRDSVQTGPFGAQLKSSEFTNEGVPVIAIGNVQWGYLDPDHLKFVSPEKARNLERYLVHTGDILFTRMGTVGRSCVVPPEAQGWLISYHIIRIAVQQCICLPQYLVYCIRGARVIHEQIERHSRGATRAGVNTTILKNLVFPLAPYDEQRRIVALLDDVQQEIHAMQDTQSGSREELDEMEQSILAQAFRGESCWE